MNIITALMRTHANCQDYIPRSCRQTYVRRIKAMSKAMASKLKRLNKSSVSRVAKAIIPSENSCENLATTIKFCSKQLNYPGLNCIQRESISSALLKQNVMMNSQPL